MEFEELESLLYSVKTNIWRSIYIQRKETTLKKIQRMEDPVQQIAIAAAAYKLGFYANEIDSIIDRSLIIVPVSAKEKFERALHEVVYRDASIVAFPRNAKEGEEALQRCPEFPEYTFSEVVEMLGGLPVAEVLQDITWMDLYENCPGFRKAFPERPNDIDLENFGYVYDWEVFWQNWTKGLKEDFEKGKRRVEKNIASRAVIERFSGSSVFAYMDIEDALAQMNEDPELKEYFEKSCSSEMDLARDSGRISPAPILQLFKYKMNFIKWLKATYNVNVKAPMYWNYYNRENVFEYVDDEDMFEAASIRNEPIFQGLLKVTRTGISFTYEGAQKLWYDFTKDIAEAAGTAFYCKEF